MVNINELQRGLLHSEYCTAESIYNTALNSGYSPVMAAAIVYRAGFRAAKAADAKKRAEVYDRMHAAEARLFKIRTTYSHIPEILQEFADMPTDDKQHTTTPRDEMEAK
ncbi:MAG: hypothetical protein Q4E13_08525 [Clostridia bacterium]|nr:hypothetical protein [Clostridia bacterium]